GLGRVARDVDWLLTVTKLVEAGVGVGAVDVAREGVELLTPYVGRAVVNAGAVAFHGVVEDYLHRAVLATNGTGADDLRAMATSAYRRLGASWWLGRIATDPVPRPRAEADPGLVLRQLPGQTAWAVGRDADECVV